jgi:hypothetical protein
MDVGTFDRKGDEHVSWTPMRLDARGWEETTDLMDETLSRVMTILEESAARLVETGEEGTTATVGILAFETPKSDDLPGASEKALERK